MITSSVISILQLKGHYSLAHQPMHVADVDFNFDAVLVGPHDQCGLVLLLNTSR